jgi:transcriptional regulator with XRE-family HTH domain
MSIDAAAAGQRPLTEEVAEEIRVAMLRRRMTGAKLAQELGVSAAWVSYRLTGVQPIDLNDLQRIAVVLGVGVLDLMPKRATAGYPTEPRVVAVGGDTDRRKSRRPIIRSGIDAPPNRPVSQTRPMSRKENLPLLPATV